MSVQLGAVGANYIYQDYDKPYYPDGNTKLVIINIGSIASDVGWWVLVVLLWM